MLKNKLEKYFDWKYYLETYSDIKRFYNNKQEAEHHFYGDGIKENRKFHPKLEQLNLEEYLSKNKHLQQKERIEIYLDYMENINDNNQQNNNQKNNNLQNKLEKYFDWKYYLETYSDIKRFYNNKQEAEHHFYGDGIKENRKFHPKLEQLNLEEYLSKNKHLQQKERIEIYLDYMENSNFSSNNNNKENYRNICKILTPLLNNIKLPVIKQNLVNETFFIEFRILNHIEFLVKKMIITLPNWSHTIICGNINYNFIINIFKNINVKIIKLNINNCNQNEYNDLLLTKNFWNNFIGEKLLLYQEDSCIFNDNIEQFLIYDYIGAPWPLHQNDNSKNVGNGGFSLRSKSKMIEVLNKINFNKLSLSQNTINYIKNCKLNNIPEDVYFSKSLIDFNIGKVPDYSIANKFSSELIYNKDSLGGHCWFLYKNFNNIEFKFYLYLKLIKFVVFYSPYEFSIGGGEKYLSFLIKYFIKKGYNILFVNDTDMNIYNTTIKFYFDKDEIKHIFNYKYNDNLFNIKQYCDYFVYMNNSSYPDFEGIGKINIYHCQFPMNIILNKFNTIIDSYNKIIVNSEFTKENLKLFYNDKNIDKINILYPPCDINNYDSINKKENTFIMIGRIFKYNYDTNNKYFDLGIDIFKKFINYNLIIIGSVKDEDYFNKLIQNCSLNIKIIRDATEETKVKYLKESKFFINFTGFYDNHKYNEEHFGIGYIESLNYCCYPISINKGYPALHIKETNYGKIINNENELINFLKEDLTKIQNKKIDLEKFNKKNFNLKL